MESLEDWCEDMGGEYSHQEVDDTELCEFSAENWVSHGDIYIMQGNSGGGGSSPGVLITTAPEEQLYRWDADVEINLDEGEMEDIGDVRVYNTGQHGVVVGTNPGTKSDDKSKEEWKALSVFEEFDDPGYIVDGENGYKHKEINGSQFIPRYIEVEEERSPDLELDDNRWTTST